MVNDETSDESFLKNGNRWIPAVVMLFVVIIVGIFPIYYDDFYFNILNAKYRFYCVSVIVLLAITVISFVVLSIIDLTKGQGIQLKQLMKRWKLTIPDLMLLVFLTVSVISTLTSDYRAQAFWGNKGRFSGLYLTLLYVASYFVVSKLLRFRSFLLDLCLFSGMLVCLFGISDYFRLDLLSFKALMKAAERDLFTSTIGNINTYTAYVALIMGLAAALFITSKKMFHKLWYLLCMTISFFAIIMGVSDNAYLAVAALFAFLPLYAFRDRQGFKAYVLMIAVFFSSIQVIDWMNQIYRNKTVPLDGVFQLIVSFDKLAHIVIGLWILVGGMYLIDDRLKEKINYSGGFACKVWIAFIVLLTFVIVFLLFDVNINGNLSGYGELNRYLLITDDWGTHRWYIWRIGIENYLEFPLVNKIFGSGPETFGIITLLNNRWDMIDRYNQIFDNAHNEYLQYFITIGPLGLFSYLGFLISSGIRMVRCASTNPYVIAILFAIICYCAQALVNLNLPIVAPIMWTLLMAGQAAVKVEDDIDE